MSQPDQTPKPSKPQAYGRTRLGPAWRVMTVLRDDDSAAVRLVMRSQNLSASGAIRHLIRLGAGLPSLLS